jgi:hypothetical protein
VPGNGRRAVRCPSARPTSGADRLDRTTCRAFQDRNVTFTLFVPELVGVDTSGHRPGFALNADEDIGFVSPVGLESRHRLASLGRYGMLDMVSRA